MHTFVDWIPFLLHASFLFFFAGLIAFLLPVNRVMMYLICVALFVFVLLYAVLTVLPVVHLDCPYRTPLSAPLWSLLRNPFNFFETRVVPAEPTMTEAVVELALQNTTARDQHALQWTLDSLTDDVELLPFVEAIPDMIYGPNGFRRVNDHLFISILGDTEVASPLVTRICNLIRGTQGMSVDDPLRSRRYMAGVKALWALSMMPCSWKRRFDTSALKTFPDTEWDVTHWETVRLALLHQEQRWCHHLAKTLRDLLANHNSSENFRNELVPTIRRLLQLVLEHFRSFDAAMSIFRRDFRQELFDLHTEIQGSTPTDAQLDKAKVVIDRFYRSHQWASAISHDMASVLSAITPAVANRTPVFEWNITCRTILSEIQLHPSEYPVRDSLDSGPIEFPPNMHKIEFTWKTKDPLDVLARIAFELVPFLWYENRQWHHMYLANRKNVEAVRYAVEGCEIHKLAQAFGDSLRSFYPDSRDQVIHAITVIANCIPYHSESIKFIDDTLAVGGPDQVSQNSTIWVTRDLRRLAELDANLDTISRSIDVNFSNLAQLQEICQDDLLRPHCPLFLPADVDVPTVIQSLRSQFFNQHLFILSCFLNNDFAPSSARMAIPVFEHQIFRNEFRWAMVDPEIQNICFEAILTHSNAILSHTNVTPTPSKNYIEPVVDSYSDLATIGEQMWSSDLFWMDIREGRPNIAGIELPCLRLLLESLKSYHAAGEKPQDGVSLDTKHSKELLVVVEQQLAIEDSVGNLH
ncbi:hypothetical protein K438DRAFT_1851431 [Mycena galopus ATCC 62051]|nr:hypothetical protein K438DRAFT_1851431 [Mycena galopus ATCC 62051]